MHGGVPRVRFSNMPTPLQEAKNLTEEIGGPRIFVKRDGLTGLAFRGNAIAYKASKLLLLPSG